jgi:hypothetical protein
MKIFKFVNYGLKMFYNMGPCYKTFYDRNLQIFVISYFGCPWQAFPAYSNEESRLSTKITEQKSFKTLAPGSNEIKLFSS